RVHVGAQADASGPAAMPARQRPDHAGSPNTLGYLDADTAQPLGHEARRLDLLETQLRPRMQVAAPAGHLFGDVCDRCRNLHDAAPARILAARPCSQAMTPSSRAENRTSSTATEAIAGLTDSRTPEKIMRGSVRCSPVVRKLATTTSSKDMMKAMIAPLTTPGAISGRITLKKVRIVPAPSDAAARTSVRSNPCRLATTVVSITGTASAVCVRMSAQRLPVMPAAAKKEKAATPTMTTGATSGAATTA